MLGADAVYRGAMNRARHNLGVMHSFSTFVAQPTEKVPFMEDPIYLGASSNFGL
jgi:hypothetical protein